MMKSRLSQCLLVGFLLLTACNSAPPSPEVFVSDSGQFEIAAPAPFEETQQSVETPVGPVEIYTFTAETENTAYVVAYSDYPAEIIEQTDPQALLDSSRDGAVNNLGGTLISEEVIDLAGNPGRSLVISANANQEQTATINSRIYLVENRLYQVLVVSPEGTESLEESSSFLDSFDLQ
jgi:hypothetical protein